METRSSGDKYRVFNLTRNTVLASEVELLDTEWTRIKGLLGRRVVDFASGKGPDLTTMSTMTFGISINGL